MKPPRHAITEWNELKQHLDIAHQELNESHDAYDATTAIYKLLVILPNMNHQLHRLKLHAEKQQSKATNK